jgi:dTMP kinase
MITLALEGIDFSGKSTQVDLLLKELKAKSKNALSFKRPGGTPLGDKIRELIKFSPIKIDWQTEQLLFAAEHSTLIKSLSTCSVTPELQIDLIVFDRWNPVSAVAYGSQAGLSVDYLRQLYSLTPSFKLDFLFIMDIPWEEAKKRSAARSETCKIEQRGDEYMSAVYGAYSKMFDTSGYLTFVAQFASKVVRIDATASAAEIHGMIKDVCGI